MIQPYHRYSLRAPTNCNRNAFIQVPIEFQIPILGLGDDYSEGYRALDVGCGDGHLVHWLQSIGVEAYGMDMFAPEGDCFYGFHLTALYPNEGSIPLDDGSTDLVVAFQNTTINAGLTNSREPIHQIYNANGENDQAFANASLRSQFFVLEASRVLKPGGRAVVYPSLDRMEQLMGFTLAAEDTIHIDHEDVDPEVVGKYVDWEYAGITMDEINPGLKKRTVLTKK